MDRVMAKVRIGATAALMVLASVACTHSVSVMLTPKKMVVLMYAEGHMAQKCAIQPNSPKFQKLNQLLQQNQGGWHVRIGSYVPTILVVGADVTLNFMGSSMVMNYNGHEYARSISPDAYGFLDCKAAL
jgi:hypothetical protein